MQRKLSIVDKRLCRRKTGDSNPEKNVFFELADQNSGMRVDVAAGGAAVVGRDDLDRGASGAVEPETGEVSKIMLSIALVSDCCMVVLT